MRKKLFAACLLIALIMIPLRAFAATDDGTIVQAYCADGSLYAFVNIAEKHENILNASTSNVAIMINGAAYGAVPPIVSLAKTETPVYFMFLIDLSTSMPSFQDNINAFAEELLKESPQNTQFLVATFGDTFLPLGDFSADQDEIRKKVKGLNYNINQTGLYRGISDAIDYLEGFERTDGGIYNLIILSDGIEYDAEGLIHEEVAKKVSESSVTIFTMGFRSNDRNSEESLKLLGVFARDSGGIHSVFDRNSNPEKAISERIVNYINGLFPIKFDIANFKTNGGGYPVAIDFYNGKEPIFRVESSYVKIPMKAVLPATTPAYPPLTNDSQTAHAESMQTGTEDAVDDTVGTAKEQSAVIVWVGIGGVGILLVAGAFLLVKKRRNKAAPTTPLPYHIFIKLEIIDGEYAGNQEFYLQNSLTIGRNKTCDIVLKHQHVSDKNARIFVQDNTVYIEDLNSKNGTALGGMRIFSPNKLRSGDIISIGSVKFRLKF